MTRFSEADLLKLQQKGLKVVDPVLEQRVKKAVGSTVKKAYSGKEKQYINDALVEIGVPFVKEHQFLENRKFRFDYCIISEKIGIEYEGIYSGKSRHTSMIGYSNDVIKYNLAVLDGWRVLRYTANNYLSVKNEVELLLNKQHDNKRRNY